MSLTVLIDLDNTLISNDMDQFLPAYLEILSSYLPQWPAEKVIHALLAGTRQMVQKNLPNHTLSETFDQVFYPGLNVEKAQIQNQIDLFYREGFPKLKGLTTSRPEARQLVDYLFSKGHWVMVATNPLFPATAIQQRLEWADLPVDRYPFSIVTSYESFHFCKPNPAYLAEILATAGWPERPAVVIGDGLEEEIIPAGKLGLPAFWVTEKSLPLPSGLHPLSDKGPVSAILPWIRRLESCETLEIQAASPAAVSAILKSTPAALDTLTRGLSDQEWHERPTTGAWAMTEIICHLRDVDREVNLPRFKQVVAGANPFFAGIVTDVWAEERSYIRENGPDAMKAFMDVRTELVVLLDSLDEASWRLPARHAIFGPTQLIELAGFITTHDRTHVHQAFETI
ncbi:MAG TPA: DinB family protein [Leptolinea sp.]